MTVDDRSNDELLALIVERDRVALEGLYDRYSRAIYSLAMNLLRDPGAAEEVAQDVFFNVWRRAGSYNSRRGSVPAWLFSIAHNRTIDELRRRKRDQARVQAGFDLARMETRQGEDPVDYVNAQFQRGEIDDALRTLRPEQREVVVLAYFGGLTQSEIASKLGHPLGTVKTRMRLALRKLREVMGPQMQESADHGL